MSDSRGPLTILGVGNVLLGDDGVGIHVIRGIRRRANRGDVLLPDRTDLVDGGTLGLDLLPVVADARALVIVDAADLGHAPGTVAVIPGDAVGSADAPLSAGRSDGVGELVDAARLLGALPSAFSLVCIQPAAIEAGLDLSGPVGAALDGAVAAPLDAARRLDAPGSSAILVKAGGRDLVGASA